MAFPWNRGGAATQIPPSERRRRNRERRERRARSVDVRRQSSRASQDRDRQRLVIVVGATLILVIFAIVAVGYYREFYQPPRVMAGEIRGVRFTMGDLVQRIRVLQGIQRYDGGTVDLSRVPFEILQSMIQAEILRQASPGLGITVTKEDIEQAVRAQFAQTAQPGQETDPGQLETESQERYRAFLTATNLSDKDYRVIVEESLAQQQLRLLLGSSIPATLEQVEVEWVRLESGGEVQPNDVKKRLETEDFAAVAAEVGSPDTYVDESGYVGWVPQGAFPDLDEVLFGTASESAATPDAQTTPPEKKEPLAVGAISEPVYTQQGVYIIRKKAGPETRELSDTVRSKLNTERVIKWQNDQLKRGSSPEEGWLKMNFNSDYYAWVADQVRVTAPRVRTENPQGQQNPLGQR